jgi:predicted Rdx family selenoprotein
MKEKEEKRVAQAGTGLEFSIALDTTLIWEILQRGSCVE